MYIPGTIFYFKPFYFLDGNASPKHKYFITLLNDRNQVIVASLPSSQDYVPAQMEKKHGCLNYVEGDFNAYYFSPQVAITTNSWMFPTHTYIYGNWVKALDLENLLATYQVPGVDYEIIGRLTSQEFNAIIACILKARTLKNRIRRLLENAVYTG